MEVCFYRLNTVELHVSLREEWSEGQRVLQRKVQE
jgi:hypothetical protein